MSEASEELKRIAVAIEEILRLVKKDMEPRIKEKKPDLPEDVPFKGRL
jgi:hypothetical protein|tara:strand:+ start:823 stop:966 length:144 start_codon:yes stop_codon:yes gene_type:complete